MVDIAKQPYAVAAHNGQAALSTLAPGTKAAMQTRYLPASIRIGLGFATTSAKSWLNGGSPTQGFLGSTKGPFSGFFHTIAGTGVANVLLMGGLLAIGTALILGIGIRLAAAGGAMLTVSDRHTEIGWHPVAV